MCVCVCVSRYLLPVTPFVGTRTCPATSSFWDTPQPMLMLIATGLAWARVARHPVHSARTALRCCATEPTVTAPGQAEDPLVAGPPPAQARRAELKAELLLAAAACNRGFGATKADRARVAKLFDALEGLSPTPDATAGITGGSLPCLSTPPMDLTSSKVGLLPFNPPVSFGSK